MKELDKTITIKCSPRELNEVVAGERKVITREILPSNANLYVTLNEERECTGIIPRDFVELQCRKYGATVTAKVEKIQLMEIVDADDEPIHYRWRGEVYQAVDIDFHIGEIVSKSGVFPIVH